MIKLMIVEDNVVVRRGLVSLLERETDFTIAAEAENGVDALDLLNTGTVCNMVLADLNMQAMDGIELTNIISKTFLNVKVVILTMHAKQDYAKKAQGAGANGFLLKHLDAEKLLDALRRISKGEMIFM